MTHDPTHTAWSGHDWYCNDPRAEPSFVEAAHKAVRSSGTPQVIHKHPHTIHGRNVRGLHSEECGLAGCFLIHD